MQVSLFTNYGALNSKPIFEAFAEGCDENIVYNDMNADVAVIWSILFQGRMAGNREVWNHFQKQNKPVIVLEVGALQRGKSWKVGINGINNNAVFGNNNGTSLIENRYQIFDLEIKPWKKDGEFITICTQRQDSLQWHGLPSTEVWVRDAIINIRAHTDKDIVIRPHPRDSITNYQQIFTENKNIYLDQPKKIEGTYDSFNFNDIVDRSWMVINHSSGPGIQAALRGTHVRTGIASLAYPVSCRSWNIMNPPKEDQLQWANWLAHTEWFEEEIAKGIPWQRLKNYI